MKLSIRTVRANSHFIEKTFRAEFDIGNINITEHDGIAKAYIRAETVRRERGKAYDQRVEIALSREDIVRLMGEFLRGGLTDFPGKDDLLQAKRSIDAFVRRLGVEGPESSRQSA